jgi:thiol:disulfide interchange protein DsbD
MPRAGPAGDLVKQVLGLLMFAVAAWFVGTGAVSLVAEKPYLARDLYWWGVAAMMLVAGLWLAMRTAQISERRFNRVFFALLGLVLAALPMWIAIERSRAAAANYRATLAGENLWVPYSEAAFNEALASGKVVVLDFTADWCLNCITLRHLVLDRDPVTEAIKRDGIVAMEVDLTSRESPGWKKLRELGEVSIPLLAIYSPGAEKPWKSNGYTVGQVVDQIDLARGRGARPPTGGGGSTVPAAPAASGGSASDGQGR